ncbi:MAG: DNA repair protein RadC [Lachnospiraceae bacterium]|nr:DNA repair protein RadC [Lachnospiraceae bacterium]MDD3615865.1 DNA repair protein RadC [Lachnospiraceae bacterium]
MQNSITMKEMPSLDRPYEKCMHEGCQCLSDAELLGVILRTGKVGETAVSLAQKVLNQSKGESGLAGLYRLTIPELMKIPGIGQVKAIQILCILELSKRIAKAGARQQLQLNKPETIARYYMEQLCHEQNEYIIAMMLDTKSHLIKDVVLSKGTVNTSLLTPRELFIEALRYQAVGIILVHNHPSGEPQPSQDDYTITKRIQKCGMLLQIPLLDHIIIGNQCYYSMREDGIIQ